MDSKFGVGRRVERVSEGWVPTMQPPEMADYQQQYVEDRNGRCQICLDLPEQGVVVSDGNRRMNLLLCRSCAAGTVLSILSLMPDDEVVALFRTWLHKQERSSILESVSKSSEID